VELLYPLPEGTAHVGASLEVRSFFTDDVGPVEVVASLGLSQVNLTGLFAQYVGVLDLSAEPEGPNTLVVEATDASLRVTTLEKTITLDRTPPAVTIIEPGNGEGRAALHDVIVEVDDAAGVSIVRLYDQGSGALLGQATDPSPAGTNRYGLIYQYACDAVPGNKTLQVRALDFAGNEGTDEVMANLNADGCTE
jgi:hypothetical protein